MCLFTPAVPGLQRRQVCKEDPDRGGLRVAGQSRPAQARSELAQAARQHHSDPLVEAAMLQFTMRETGREQDVAFLLFFRKTQVAEDAVGCVVGGRR